MKKRCSLLVVALVVASCGSNGSNDRDTAVATSSTASDEDRGEGASVSASSGEVTEASGVSASSDTSGSSTGLSTDGVGGDGCYWEQTSKECMSDAQCEFVDASEVDFVNGECVYIPGDAGWCMEVPYVVQTAPSAKFHVETERVFVFGANT